MFVTPFVTETVIDSNCSGFSYCSLSIKALLLAYCMSGSDPDS